ncbi:C-22 sterol desaturase erg5 [Aspergillus tanneri]|uniref:sterol 22-desaturase n=1 Tax=Aspergillus tanneri TaxID=1220188 RepID=A0A5M9N1X9_9EURO|nr:RNA polymerase C-22 sterol desaturase [Aspergillus tanneri]KAA8648567.1 RNA polymerase C-22 sterol desaturase [Aspergillus tanneri]
MASVSGSFVSPAADATVTPQLLRAGGLAASLLEGFNVWKAILTLFIAAVIYDQHFTFPGTAIADFTGAIAVRYVWQKGSIVGPAWKLPFMGPFLQSVNPKFHEYKAKWDSGELSCVSVFHKFVVIASTRDMSRKIFNSPGYVKPCVVDVAHKLLGRTNWVFLDGRDHVEFRKGLNGLFTRQALSCYLPRLEEEYNRYYKHFLEKSAANKHEPTPWMPEFRELMCAVSCRTFVGHYISDEAIKKIADDYYMITAALELVNFPFILPYTKAWYGKKASDMVLDEFSRCAAKSKARMAAGGDVTCIMDAWVKAQQDSAKYREKIAQGIHVDTSEKPPQVLRDFTNYEIAQTIFTFLFASQDATSAASTWLFQLMADRPDVLDKVREENLRMRNGDINAPLTMELLDKLEYTRAVVKETLRYRPPVIMVPYMVKKDFPITDKITVSKGSMIIPSVWPATHDEEAYPNPDTFDPDRWITGTAEQHPKNWLVFGTGPHYCLGQTYAQLNLMAMIGKASLEMDWEHTPTPESEDIKVFATIFPQDDCLLSFRPRPHP